MKDQLGSHRDTEGVNPDELWDSIASSLDGLEVSDKTDKSGGRNYKWLVLSGIIIGTLVFYYSVADGKVKRSQKESVTLNNQTEGSSLGQDDKRLVQDVGKTDETKVKKGRFEEKPSNDEPSDKIAYPKGDKAKEVEKVSSVTGDKVREEVKESSVADDKTKEVSKASSIEGDKVREVKKVFTDDPPSEAKGKSRNHIGSGVKVEGSSLESGAEAVTGDAESEVIPGRNPFDSLGAVGHSEGKKGETQPIDTKRQKSKDDNRWNGADQRAFDSTLGFSKQNKGENSSIESFPVNAEVTDLTVSSVPNKVLKGRYDEAKENPIVHADLDVIRKLHVGSIQSPYTIKGKRNIKKRDDGENKYWEKKKLPMEIGLLTGVNTFQAIYQNKGLDGSNAVRLGDSFRKQLGHTTALTLTYHLHDKWSVGAGVQYVKLRSLLDYKHVKEVPVSLGQFVSYYEIDSITGQQVNQQFEELFANGIETRTVLHHNKSEMISIPLVISYGVSKGRINYGLGAGLSINWIHSQSGKTLDLAEVVLIEDSGDFKKMDFFKGYHLSPYIESQWREKIKLRVQATIKYTERGLSNYFNPSEKGLLFALQFGLVYHL